MTEQEVAKVLYVLNVNYKTDSKTSAEEMEKRLKLWANEFMNEEGKIVAEAVRRHISNSPFYPSCASINKYINEIKQERFDAYTHPDNVPIKVGNKTYYATDISTVDVTPAEEEFLENLWNNVANSEG